MLWTVDVNISVKRSISAGMGVCKNTTYAAGSFVVNENLQMLWQRKKVVNSFIRIRKQFSTKKGGCIWKFHIIGRGIT